MASIMGKSVVETSEVFGPFAIVRRVPRLFATCRINSDLNSIAKNRLENEFNILVDSYFGHDAKIRSYVWNIVYKCLDQAFSDRGRISEQTRKTVYIKNTKKTFLDVSKKNTTLADFAKRKQKVKNYMRSSDLIRLVPGIMEEIWSYLTELVRNLSFELACDENGLFVQFIVNSGRKKNISGNLDSCLHRLVFAACYAAINSHKREQYRAKKHDVEPIEEHEIAIPDITSTIIDELVAALLPIDRVRSNTQETVRERNKRMKTNSLQLKRRQKYVDRINKIMTDKANKIRLSESDQKFLNRFKSVCRCLEVPINRLPQNVKTYKGLFPFGYIQAPCHSYRVDNIGLPIPNADYIRSLSFYSDSFRTIASGYEGSCQDSCDDLKNWLRVFNSHPVYM